MSSSQDLLLWEDLGTIHRKTSQAYEMLQSLLGNLNDGQIDQPSRQDSQYLNRLTVLADLFYDELRTWLDSVEPEGLKARIAAAAHRSGGKGAD